MDGHITKGSRIRAEWFKCDDPPGCLAGMQMKVTASKMEIVGVVKHFRGDAPVNPRVIRIYVDPDHAWAGKTVRPEGCTCDHEHVEVNPAHVVGTV